jgi:hypothetical protein
LFFLACTKAEAPAPAEPAVTESEPEEASGDTPSATKGQQRDKGIDIPPGDKILVKLIDVGKEPLRALRWSIEQPLEQELSIEAETEAQGILGRMVAATAPARPATYRIKVQAKEIVPGEPLRVTFKIEKANADLSNVAEAAHTRFKKAARAVKGSKGSYLLDSRGTLKEIQIELPSDAPREAHNMAQTIEWSLSQMLVSFPKEPVGEGAKWQVVRAVELGGIRVGQSSTVELVKVRGSLVDIKADIQRTAPTQAFEVRGMSGKKAVLAAFSGNASLQATWDIAEVVPRSASVVGSEDRTVRFEADDRKTQSSATVKRTASMRGK